MSSLSSLSLNGNVLQSPRRESPYGGHGELFIYLFIFKMIFELRESSVLILCCLVES